MLTMNFLMFKLVAEKANEPEIKLPISVRSQKSKRIPEKHLHDKDNHDGLINHLEPDILECEVKWTLGSITTNKASGGEGIPVELFKS